MPSFDTREKRQDVVTVGRPYVRNTFPKPAGQGFRWRHSIGNTYGDVFAATVIPGPNIVILAVDGSCCCLPDGPVCVACVGGEYNTTPVITVAGMTTPTDFNDSTCTFDFCPPDNWDGVADGTTFINDIYNDNHTLTLLESACDPGATATTLNIRTFEPNDQFELFKGTPTFFNTLPVLSGTSICGLLKCLDICSYDPVTNNNIIHLIQWDIFLLCVNATDCDMIGRLMFYTMQFNGPPTGASVLGVGYTPRFPVVDQAACFNGGFSIGHPDCIFDCSQLNVSITSWYDAFGNNWVPLCQAPHPTCCGQVPKRCGTHPGFCGTIDPCKYGPECLFNLVGVTATISGL